MQAQNKFITFHIGYKKYYVRDDMKRLFILLMVCTLTIALCPSPAMASGTVQEDEKPAVNASSLDINAKSAILMEAQTGKILYEQNVKEAFSPASVTKIMTLLLVMEAIESGKINENEMVTVSEHAASMGGSQVFLAVGEQFSVKELIKCTVIASANDAAVALAEHTYGSEASFVEAMNLRAKELEMQSSCFENVTGLDDTTNNHVTSALDIAIMSRKLLTYPMITEFSSTWMDTIRDGAFTITNTNRLVRFYPGATGLKTGSTEKAKFCLSASAKRNGMTLIAVIMGADTRDIRNSEAMRLLDYGFANYALYESPEITLDNVHILKGEKDALSLYAEPFSIVVEKGNRDKIVYKIEVPDCVVAPVKEQDIVGKVVFTLDGVIIGESQICALEEINAVTFGKLLKKMIQTFLHPH